MDVLNEAVRLIIQPPGDLVYFLVTLYALQQAIFPALAARKTAARTALAQRWLWVIGGMLLGRLVLVVVALLGNANILAPAIAMPPLERWIGVASILLVVWAAVFGSRAKRWQTILLGVLLVLSLAFYVYNVLAWPAWKAAGYAYNEVFYEQIWALLALLLTLLGFALALLLRSLEWEWVGGVFLFWMAGYVLQLRWPDTQAHFSGWYRLAGLVVYPLISALVHRQLIFSTREVQTATPEGLGLDSNVLYELLHGMDTGRDLEPSLILASSRLAQVLNAEMCAIALPDEESAEQLRVVALHPPNAAQIETPILQISDYPAIAEAWNAQEPQIVQPATSHPWVEALYEHLGFNNAGPLSIVPLHYQDQQVGLLLLGNPESRRRWREAALEVQQLVATLFTGTIVRAREQRKDLSLVNRLRGQDSERQRLSAALEQAQGEVKSLNGRLSVLVQEIKARDKEILRLNREIEGGASKLSATEVSFWESEVRELAQERERLQSQADALVESRDTLQAKVRELTRDRSVLLEDRNRLAEELSEMKNELDVAVDAREAAREEWAQLQARLAKIETEMKTRLEAQAKQVTGEGLSVGLVIVNEDGEIVIANAPARRMLRLPKGDVQGMPIDGAYPDPRWSQTIDALLIKNVSNPLDRAHLTLSNDDTTIEAQLVPINDRSGEPVGLAITLQSPESSAERQEAIIGLANDFRTPMTSISGYIDLLLGEQGGILTEIQQQFLQRVKANIEQMGHLLNDLVRLASPDSRPIELSPQKINLIELIEEAIMGLAARFRERNLAVRMDLPPELTAVKADRDSLYQIILRLLSNAALCSREGTEVVISAREKETEVGDGKLIRISVSDTGGGIAPEDYSRVFRRFYRASQPLVQGMGETGVGMAVAKTLVEANNGEIWVDSEPGVGSTFTFVLPTNGTT